MENHHAMEAKPKPGGAHSIIRSLVSVTFLLIGARVALAQVTNLGVPGWIEAVGDEMILVKVLEKNHGLRDLNGDGDALDSVLHVFDPRTGRTTNLGIVAENGNLTLRGNFASFSVRESSQGVDLNGDGDLLDLVPHVYDHSSGSLVNLGLASFGPVYLGRGFVGFSVSERDQSNTDLNGDGLVQGSVCHVYRPGSGVSNLRHSFLLGLEEDVGLVSLEETIHGDLNGDGDSLDRTTHLLDFRTEALTNLRMHVESFSIEGNQIAVRVLEVLEGRDLNGDGDLLDGMIYVVDGDRATITDTGADSGELRWFHGNSLVILRDEGWAQVDFDGDGQLNSWVPHVYDLQANTLTNTGFSTVHTYVGRGFVFLFGYERQGQDLNGDGDATDNIPHVLRSGSSQVTALPVALPSILISGQVSVGEETVLFTVSETTQGSDLNGDGDSDDEVSFLYDSRTDSVTNLYLTSKRHVHNGDDFLLLGIDESSVDWNGDGDLSDSILQVYDRPAQTLINLGLPAFTGHRTRALGKGDLAMVPVRESFENRDLNGDGDFGDVVLHAIAHSGVGSVNLGAGKAEEILRINQKTGWVEASRGEALEISLSTSPSGPSTSPYVLWVWRGSEVAPVELRAGRAFVGRLTNPTPMHLPTEPGRMPFLCGGSPGFLNRGCGTETRIPLPVSAPFSASLPQGMNHASRFIFQAVLRDHGAGNSQGLSVSNAVRLRIE